MHILYVVQYFNLPSEPGGGRAYHFARRWVELGHEVTVVTGTVNHKTATVDPRYRGRLFYRETIDGVDLLRCASTAGRSRSLLARLTNFVSFAALSTFAGLFRTRRPDVVYASSTPLTIGLPGYLASRRWRIPFVFEIRDLWPESARVAGIIRNRAVLYMAGVFERFLYRAATRIVAVTEGIKDGIVAGGIDEDKVDFIPNGVDDILAGPPGTGASTGASSGFVCMYMGALGMWNGNETIIEAAALLRDEKEIEFVFIGDGDHRAELERQAREKNLTSVRFVGALPKQEAIARLSQADVALICTWDHPFHRMVLANKIFDYLAAGRPVVAAAAGEMERLLSRSGSGITVLPGRADEFAAAIRRLRDMTPEERRAMGESGRRHVLENYLRRDLAARAEETMRRSIEAHGAR